ncbi:MAG: serine/threonine-protein kinase [Prevotellaceae bacterium]|nr:serine/threonine-protein kinase [Prevotellaceae bacterium]
MIKLKKIVMINIHKLHSSQTPLDNRYLLKERIGGGGFSDVWLALDLRSQVDVVLKIYASGQELDDEGIRMFRKEFAIVCNLNHTNILKPFTFDIFNGSPYIVLPYCEKGSASRYVGRITEEQLWDFAGQVAAGLAHLHKHNIIHQDIKPANVLINKDDQFMITDFGISTGLRNTIRKTNFKENNDGSGTTAYMSYECLGPEQSNVIARDIWAFGATLYELATGNVPFGELGGVTQNASGGSIPKIKSKEFSNDIKNLIYKCLALKTWNRPSAEEIVKIVNDHGKIPPKPIRWKKFAAISSVALACAIVAFLIILPHPTPKHVIINPNDKIALAQIDSAITIVSSEMKKNNVEKRDVEKLSEAAKIYNDAIALNVTDTILNLGKSKWIASQTAIDDTYKYLSDMSIGYNNIEAYEAGKTYGERCKVLENYVSDSIKVVMSNKETSTVKKDRTFSKKTNSKPLHEAPVKTELSQSGNLTLTQDEIDSFKK